MIKLMKKVLNLHICLEKLIGISNRFLRAQGNSTCIEKVSVTILQILFSKKYASLSIERGFCSFNIVWIFKIYHFLWPDLYLRENSTVNPV